MPLLIQNRALDRITSTGELFDRHPHLKVCFQKVWLHLACRETVSSYFSVSEHFMKDWITPNGYLYTIYNSMGALHMVADANQSGIIQLSAKL